MVSLMNVIGLRDLHVDCIIGVHPEEQATKQRVELDVELTVPLDAAAKSDSIADTLDYAFLSEQIRFVLSEGRFGLLETASAALCSLLLAPPCPDDDTRPQAARVRLEVRKPAALPEACPFIRFERERSWLSMGFERQSFGTVDILFESASMGLYRLHVGPGKTIPRHVHRNMLESEMVLGDGLLCQNHPAARGSVRRWHHNEAHCYTNPSSRTQSILCIDRPPFIASDEIPVD